tara:strand:+ start:1034 stop:1429 length:396 start_codon:yes stop_codon:yes gene_type:complete
MATNKKGDCILFSNLSYLLLKEYNKKYSFNGGNFKYLSIKIDRWGKGVNDFHQFITFKYDNKWYYLDRFECALLNNKYRKKYKKIDLASWINDIDLVKYIHECGYKNQIEAENNIFKIVDNHLLKLTRKIN